MGKNLKTNFVFKRMFALWKIQFLVLWINMKMWPFLAAKFVSFLHIIEQRNGLYLWKSGNPVENWERTFLPCNLLLLYDTCRKKVTRYLDCVQFPGGIAMFSVYIFCSLIWAGHVDRLATIWFPLWHLGGW